MLPGKFLDRRGLVQKKRLERPAGGGAQNSFDNAKTLEKRQTTKVEAWAIGKMKQGDSV